MKLFDQINDQKQLSWKSQEPLPLPNDKHPEYFELEKYIKDTLSSLRSAMQELANSNADFSAKDIINRYKSEKKATCFALLNGNTLRITVKEYYDKLMDRMEKKRQFSTRGTYVEAFKWVNKFKGMDNLQWAELNRSFLEDLLAFMIFEKEKERDNGGKGKFEPSTLFGYFKNFKAFMNKALEDEIITDSCSNYKKFKLSQFKVDKKPRPIPIEEIEQIMKLELTPYSRIWNSKNYLLFSFLGNGINFADMATLSNENIVNGRVTYVRAKTGETCTFKLNPLSQKIIDSYKGKTYSDLIFPILKKTYTARARFVRINTARGDMNDDLKIIQGRCGIKTNLTF